MIKTVVVRGGFAVLIVVLNAGAGALLSLPFVLTLMGATHVWNMATGGPSVIGNDGSLPVIVGTIGFLVGVALTVGANFLAVWVTKELTNQPVLLPGWGHLVVATGSGVLGAMLASPWLRDTIGQCDAQRLDLLHATRSCPRPHPSSVSLGGQ